METIIQPDSSLAWIGASEEVLNKPSVVDI